MSVTEHLMRPGNGNIVFTPDLPTSISKRILALVNENAGGPGAHVFITNTHIDPRAVDDVGIRSAAMYAGRIIKRPSRLSLDFVGLGSWLDSYLDADVSRTAGTPAQWAGDLLANNLTAGTVNATGASNVTRAFLAHSATRRDALDTIARLGGWEYRIRPTFAVDIATKANLFKLAGGAKTIVVTRKSEGPGDGIYRGLEGSLLDEAIDVSRLDTKAVALAEGMGASIVKGTATVARSLKAPLGATPSLVTVFSAPSEPSVNANNTAQNVLNLQGMRRQISVSSKTHVNIPSKLTPGDEVYVYDLQAGLVDTTNQIQFRGGSLFPVKVRCLSYTWPIERGYGVYIRSNAASGAATIIDVTPWVAWESGDTSWVVGDWAPANYGRVNRSEPEIEERASTTKIAHGIVAWKPGAHESQAISTTPFTLWSLTVNLSVGRMYELSYGVRAVVVASGNCRILANCTGILTNDAYIYCPANYGSLERSIVFSVPSSGSRTFIVEAIGSGAGTLWNGGCTLAIKDIGPAINAS